MKSDKVLPGTLIRQQRVARGMSLREAARLLDLTHVEMGAVERNLQYLTPDQEVQWQRVLAIHRPKDATPAREVTPGSFALLEMDAEPVGGWWPDDVGEPVVRTEGPLHPRVGTVVGASDLWTLPRGTLVDGEHGVSVYGIDNAWLGTCRWKHCMTRETADDRHIIGATILYVPLR